LHAAQPSVSFALVAVIVLFLTSIVAGLHYHFVERWFMSFRGSVAGRTQLPGRERTAPDARAQSTGSASQLVPESPLDSSGIRDAVNA